METIETAIVGAGPFGLSLAAHLAGRDARVFGEPMRTWRTLMPPDMRLRSGWAHTSLASPGARGSLDAWAVETGAPPREPIALADFLAYADWFRARHVPGHDARDVAHVGRDGNRFRLRLADGAELGARNVVLAVGVTPFPVVPDAFAGLDDPRVGIVVAHRDVAGYRGRRVVVIGGGQNALESALLARRAGAASVEVLVRSELRWFAERDPHAARGAVAQRLLRLAYPVVGFGPPPINRIATHPDAFAVLLPSAARVRLNRRLLRPGGSPWLRAAVEDAVVVRERCAVERVEARGADLRLVLADGGHVEADAVILAAGFRFALDRLALLDPALRAEIRTRRGFPVLDRSYRSTAPGVLFAGFAAEERFGPLSRYVEGTRFAAPRLADAVGSAAA